MIKKVIHAKWIKILSGVAHPFFFYIYIYTQQGEKYRQPGKDYVQIKKEKEILILIVLSKQTRRAKNGKRREEKKEKDD